MTARKPPSSRPPPGNGEGLDPGLGLGEERCADDDGVSAAPGSGCALPGGRCPRCGGLGDRRRRQRANPFLTDTEPLVCTDCGLDFQQDEIKARKPPESLPPWG